MDNYIEDTKKSITDETISASYQVGPIKKQESKNKIEVLSPFEPVTTGAYKDASAPRQQRV